MSFSVRPDLRLLQAQMAKSKSSPTYANLRRVLIEARKGAGMKQADLAARLGKPQSYVSKIEAGERRLDVVEFAEYAAALGIDPARMLKRLLGK